MKILLYLDSVLIADVNTIAKNRKLEESLKSEQTSATSDQFSFEMNWLQFKRLAEKRFDEYPMSLLRIGKTRVVFMVDDYIRFSGWLAVRPARSDVVMHQTLSLTFYEHFARLSGDLVCDPNNKMSPIRRFVDRPTHLYVQDLINEFLARARAAGEQLNWTYGIVNTLAGKTFEYKDFQTISKALCDAMNNVEGAGKFDVVIRTDPENHNHQIIDILKPRGTDTNIIIKYPGDGVYALWASGYEYEESNEYASEVLVSGNGEVGNPASGENTAQLGGANDANAVAEYCYWRTYTMQSNLTTAVAVQAYADKALAAATFEKLTPKLKLQGLPIRWGDTSTGLSIGDTFYLKDEADDGADESGRMRITAMSTEYDNNGVATVQPTLKRVGYA